MLRVNKKQFLEEGYTVIRNVVAPEQLDHLRRDAEELVRRRWPQGITEQQFQPMVHGHQSLIDEQIASTVELFLREDVLDATRVLMPGEPAPSAMFLMCNPIVDWGPWWWHRDVNPITKGPLEGLQEDTRANGPTYMHWNVALYDDEVLWVVPGSHLRPNTDEENRQLAAVDHHYGNSQLPQSDRRHTPLPGSVCPRLNAGDALLNQLEILHWGSRYGPVQRRTFHVGFRSFAGAGMFYEGWDNTSEFTRFLSQPSQKYYDRLKKLHEQENDTIESTFRAIIDHDAARLRNGLAKLHPGETARFMCLVHLCKYAQQMHANHEAIVGNRFTADEIDVLWQRFAPLDAALQTDLENYVPAFQIRGPTHYRLNEMPPDFGIDEFIAVLMASSN